MFRSHHTRRPMRSLLTVAFVASGVAVAAAELRPEALEGWKTYVQMVERRRLDEKNRAGRFLMLDFAPTAREDRRAVLSGNRVVRRVSDGYGAAAVDVRGALVHHWRGAVLVRGATVDQLVAKLQQGPPPQRDVLRASVLARAGDAMSVALRLQRTKIVTVVYDTEHDVRFDRLGAGRAASSSVATRILQLEDPGTARERALPAGQDDGYLWRLNSYWRYEQVAEGVIAECESVTLSRSIPFGLQTVAGPIVRSTARESMEAALAAVADWGQVKS
jgi:hypothetical protein